MNDTARARARIGVLVPFTNTNLEADMAMLRPDGITFHYARMGGYDVDKIPDNEQMAGLGRSDIEEPLRLLSGAKPDLVMYGCTSATLAVGSEFDRGLAAKINGSIGAQTVTAAGALVHGLESLGAKRIAFASPYVPALNDEAIRFLASYGFETVSRADVDEPLDNYGQGRLSPERVFELGMSANSETADVLVLSCTDMRAIEAIGKLEAAIEKPVVTSNQAMLFQALAKLGVAFTDEKAGSLFAMLKQ